MFRVIQGFEHTFTCIDMDPIAFSDFEFILGPITEVESITLSENFDYGQSSNESLATGNRRTDREEQRRMKGFDTDLVCDYDGIIRNK